MKKILAFRVEIISTADPAHDGEPHSRALIQINGVSLLNIVREFELPLLAAESRPSVDEMRAWPLANEHTARSLRGWSDYLDGTSTILDCKCGFTGCWPLTAKIIRTSTTVTWKRFTNFHRSGHNGKFSRWPYEQLGPFHFSRAQYDSEIKKIA